MKTNVVGKRKNINEILTGAASSFTDKRDGQVYKTVRIGSQVWMARNLNYAAMGSKCYGEGGKVIIIENNERITKTITDKEIQANCAKYGRLYTWDAAEKACPSGWHLPSDAEWMTLTDYVGTSAGKKLKSKTGWEYYKDDAVGIDEYGFSGLPGGYGFSNGDFIGAGYGGFWWSATEVGAGYAYYRFMGYGGGDVIRYGNGETGGDTRLLSVRCVQD